MNLVSLTYMVEVIAELTTNYDIKMADAINAVKSSRLHYMLENYPEQMVNIPVKKSARYVYKEICGIK